MKLSQYFTNHWGLIFIIYLHDSQMDWGLFWVQQRTRISMPWLYRSYTAPKQWQFLMVWRRPSGRGQVGYSGMLDQFIIFTLFLLFSIFAGRLDLGGADLPCFLLILLLAWVCLTIGLLFLLMKISLQQAFILQMQTKYLFSKLPKVKKISYNYPPLPHQIFQL